MSKALRSIVEKQVQKARLEGQLDGLEGEGQPLPDRTRDAFLDAGEAAGFRLMAQAGVVPEEVALKKQMAEQRKRLGALKDPDARKPVMAELTRLELRYNIAREARQKFLRG
jgi:hypothetical protein